MKKCGKIKNIIKNQLKNRERNCENIDISNNEVYNNERVNDYATKWTSIDSNLSVEKFKIGNRIRNSICKKEDL